MQIIFRMVEAVSRIKSNEVANVAMSSSAGYMRMRYEPKVGCVAMSSSAARSADRGGGAERRRGWKRINIAASQTLLLSTMLRSRFAAVSEKPPRSVGPLPLSRRSGGDTGGDIAAFLPF